jgi:hypothetical protein
MPRSEFEPTTPVTKRPRPTPQTAWPPGPAGNTFTVATFRATTIRFTIHPSLHLRSFLFTNFIFSLTFNLM